MHVIPHVEWASGQRCSALTTRDGLLIDELVARVHESEYYPMLCEIYHQALVAGFDLSRMVDGMQEDLESGKTRNLPKERFNEDEFPF